MKIVPISNINRHNTQFKANFCKRDITELLKEIDNNRDVDIVPKLYTMLDVIKKQSGRSAKIMHMGLWHKISIDGKPVNDEVKYFTAFHALEGATVKKNNVPSNTLTDRLTEEEFENMVYKNSKKTIDDIKSLFKE